MSGERKTSVWDYFGALSGARVDARLTGLNRARSVAFNRPNVQETPEDFAAFAAENPVAADKIWRLRRTGQISSTVGIVSGVAGGLHSYRRNKMPQFFVVTGLLVGLGLGAVADQTAVWALGTYTFDPMTPVEEHADFMRKRYPDAPTMEEAVGWE